MSRTCLECRDFGYSGLIGGTGTIICLIGLYTKNVDFSDGQRPEDLIIVDQGVTCPSFRTATNSSHPFESEFIAQWNRNPA